MTEIMKSSVTIGTLRYGAAMRSIDPNLTGSKFTFVDKQTGKKFDMPVSGKTGTTQNWGDAWAVGYTPYYTCAVWFGFDTPGKSMGMSMTGSSLSGPLGRLYESQTRIYHIRNSHSLKVKFTKLLYVQKQVNGQ